MPPDQHPPGGIGEVAFAGPNYCHTATVLSFQFGGGNLLFCLIPQVAGWHQVRFGVFPQSSHRLHNHYNNSMAANEERAMELGLAIGAVSLAIATAVHWRVYNPTSASKKMGAPSFCLTFHRIIEVVCD